MAAAPNSDSVVRIRTATAADIPRMVPVVNTAFAIEKFLEGFRTDEQGMTDMMQKGEFLLAEDEPGRLLGCVYTELRGERGYFGMLAVGPAEQGKGLGRRMVEAAEDRCRRHGRKFMDITVLNLRPELLPFYRKLGYVETGSEEFRTSRAFKAGVQCHCIVMSKAL